MLTRRELVVTAAVAAAATKATGAKPAPPVAVASANGLPCVAKAVERMKAGADPLDAAIDGVAILEDDPADMTVGFGGIPNEEGIVQLDASVMHGPSGRAGAVASLEGIKNPARVAKVVME